MSQVVVCWSPEHGQGTTFVSVAMAMAAMGKQRTLLVDADLIKPMVTTLVGIEPTHRIEQLFPYIAGGSLTQELFKTHTAKKGSLHVLAGMGRSELAQEDDTANFMMQILALARTQYDLIIVDAGAGISHAGSYAAIAAADHVAVVVQPNFLVAKTLKLWQLEVEETLPKALHAPKAGIILNRYVKKMMVSQAEIARYCDLPLWAELPDDHMGFLNALNRGDFGLWKYAAEQMWVAPLSLALKEMQGGDK